MTYKEGGLLFFISVCQQLPLPSLTHQLSPYSHLKEHFPVRPGMRECWRVVIFIQDGDVSGAGGASGRRTSILYHHHKLVTGLLLSVQSEAGADLTYRKTVTPRPQCASLAIISLMFVRLIE